MHHYKDMYMNDLSGHVKVEVISTELNYSVVRYITRLYFVENIWLVPKPNGTYIHGLYLNSETRIEERK